VAGRAQIGIIDLVRMKLLGINYQMIVQQKIALVQAGVPVKTQEMERTFCPRGTCRVWPRR
jgi:uncharacterized protein YqfA (UPF0365 family)